MHPVPVGRPSVCSILPSFRHKLSPWAPTLTQCLLPPLFSWNQPVPVQASLAAGLIGTPNTPPTSELSVPCCPSTRTVTSCLSCPQSYPCSILSLSNPLLSLRPAVYFVHVCQIVLSQTPLRPSTCLQRKPKLSCSCILWLIL